MRHISKLLIIVLMVPAVWALDNHTDGELLDLLDSGPAPSVPTDADFEDLRDILYKNNLQIQAAYAGYRSQMALVPAARSLPEPHLTSAVFVNPIVTARGPQQFKLGIQQRIPGLKQRQIQERRQMEMAEASFFRVVATMNDQALQLAKVYADGYFYQRELSIKSNWLEILKQWESIILARYRTAQAQHPDLIRSQLEVLTAEDKLAVIQNRIENTRSQLGALLNLDASELDFAPDSLQLPTHAAVPDKDADYSGNPALKSREQLSAASKSALDLEKIQRRPKLMLGLDWSVIGKPESPAVSNPGSDALAVTMGFSLPAWPARNKALVVSASEQAAAAEQRYLHAARLLAAQLESATRQLVDDQRHLELLETTILPKARDTYVVQEKAYAGGQSDFQTVLTTLELYFQYQLEAERARAEVWKSYYARQIMMGVTR